MILGYCMGAAHHEPWPIPFQAQLCSEFKSIAPSLLPSPVLSLLSLARTCLDGKAETLGFLRVPGLPVPCLGHCLGWPEWPRLNSPVMSHTLEAPPALGTAECGPPQLTEMEREGQNWHLPGTSKLCRICSYFCHSPDNKMVS